MKGRQGLSMLGFLGYNKENSLIHREEKIMKRINNETNATVNNNAENNKSKKKKPFYKKWKFWLLLLIVLVIGRSSNDFSEGVNDGLQEVSSESAQMNDSNKTKEFLDKVKEQIAGSVDTVNEHITDVTLKEKDLYITVDLSKVNSEPLTIEDIAISRVGSITDSLFDMEEKYLKMWNTVTIDFGKVGKTTLTKTKDDTFFGTEEYYNDFK